MGDGDCVKVDSSCRKENAKNWRTKRATATGKREIMLNTKLTRAKTAQERQVGIAA